MNARLQLAHWYKLVFYAQSTGTDMRKHETYCESLNSVYVANISSTLKNVVCHWLQALRRCMSLFPNGSCSKERLDLGLPREATVSTSVKCSHVKACEDHVWKQTQHNVEADKWCRETVAYKSATAPELCQTRCRIVQIRGEILNAWFCCDHKCYGRWNKSLPPLGSVFLFFIGGGGALHNCQENKRETC